MLPSAPTPPALAAAIAALSVSFLLSACRTDRGLATATAAATAPASEPGQPSAAELTEIAHRLVTTTLGVHPGDVVVIDGGPHTVGLMEEIAIEAEKAGGLPNMWLESPRVARALMTEVPDKYLDQKPSYLASWYGHTTVWIGLGAFEDPKAVFADVPEAKLARLNAAGQEVFGMLNASPIRAAFLEYPTTGQAALVGLPVERFRSMQWAAIGADYTQIAATANALKARLATAKEVHITTGAGTDLRFALAGRPIVVNAGIVSQGPAREKLLLNRFVSLPGGAVSLAPKESSVSGTLVVPRDRCKFKPLVSARYTFASGTLTGAKAAEGDVCLQDNLTVYGAPMHRLASLTIGLNPGLQVIEESGVDYRPGAAAGQVTLALGDNQLLGGANAVPGGVSVDLPVTHATVEIDGEKVIEDGKLVGNRVAIESQ
ncbi:MAG TPA: aminopeptidase [Gemmatimonadales bacterium]|nr:aminopeptidase [Gemmatimonadales bacterium]